MRTRRILIIGSGVAGQDVLREINEKKSLRMQVVGFLDDNVVKKGKSIKGKPVLGTRDSLKRIVKQYKVEEVIIAIPSARGEDIAIYVQLCSEAKVAFRIVPRVKEIIAGRAEVSTLRKVRVEDLLGRPVVKEDVAELKEFFERKIILVTGAAGSIGSELSRQIAAYDPVQLILLDFWESGMFDIQQELLKSFPREHIEYVICNLLDKQKLTRVMYQYKPHIVFHAAAYKHVPLMEDNPEEAIKNNVFGTLNLAKLAVKVKAERFVLVSTDKAANPKSVMGASKLITEAIGKSLNGKTKFMAVRFGNVLASNGSVIPTFIKQIEAGGPITVTDPRMSRYFMTIPEASQLIIKAGSIGKGGELFVLDMGKPVKILDLAENIIRLSGLVPGRDIEIVFTGIRRGEKLHERLFNSKETLNTTQKEKIFVTESLGMDLKKLPKILKDLELYAKNGRISSIRKSLSKAIKSFVA